MVFSSAFFLFVFLPTVLLGVLLTRNKVQNVLLLLASLFFYAWGSFSHLLILIVSIGLNYWLGRRVGSSEGRNRKVNLGIAVGVNLLFLVYLKYFNFIVENINVLLSSLDMAPIECSEVSLPIGVSFFTFQALSYLIDVYRKNVEVQKSFIQLALYISLFPQLVAGPIVRYIDVSKQLAERSISLSGFASGIQRFIVGLAKKVIIANSLGVVVDQIMVHDALELSMPVAWLGIIAYALQIYFDFSGYSDMAIGLGKMFGFEFPENFNFPYIAKSIREFWRRWHISLSTWFRDYLYIPLGGSRIGKRRTLINLLIVFFLTGLWHGASWNFVIWGLFHGLFLLLERVWLERLFAKLWRPLLNLYTILVVLVAWVFFRLEELPDALSYLSTMFTGPTEAKYFIVEFLDLKTITILIVGIVLAYRIPSKIADRYALAKAPNYIVLMKYSLQLTGLLVLFFVTISYLAGSSYNPFIYFKF